MVGLEISIFPGEPYSLLLCTLLSGRRNSVKVLIRLDDNCSAQIGIPILFSEFSCLWWVFLTYPLFFLSSGIGECGIHKPFLCSSIVLICSPCFLFLQVNCLCARSVWKLSKTLVVSQLTRTGSAGKSPGSSARSLDASTRLTAELAWNFITSTSTTTLERNRKINCGFILNMFKGVGILSSRYLPMLSNILHSQFSISVNLLIVPS